MPVKVTFELSDADLQHFKKLMSKVRERTRSTDETGLLKAAQELIESVNQSSAAAFVSERISRLEVMVKMLEDVEWKMEGSDRARVVDALAYFAEREDLIPDHIPVLGFLDDAIMVELVVSELKHEIEAYDDFRRYRSRKEKLLGNDGDPASRETWLKARRKELQQRMRRRRRRQTTSRRPSSSSSSRSPFGIL